MTSERLETYYLTFRFWIRRSVLPAIIVLIFVLLLVRWLSPGQEELDKIAAITGFLAIYYTLVRGGHIYMIRTMHMQLKKEFAGVYPIALSDLPSNMKIRQIGFSLARIKAELYRRSK